MLLLYIPPSLPVGTNGTPCPHVECAPLPSECVGVTPAGACCPQCGESCVHIMRQTCVDNATNDDGCTYNIIMYNYIAFMRNGHLTFKEPIHSCDPHNYTFMCNAT